MSMKSARERAGITQEQAAAALGINHTSIVGWERGKWLPKTPRLLEVANLYKCTVDELLQNEPEERHGT